MRRHPQSGSVSISVIVLFLIFIGVASFAYTRISSENIISVETDDAPLAQKTEVTDFTFSAAGDFDNNTNAEAVIALIGKQNTAFTIALGDLGYSKGKETEWCNMVKERVGNDYPFELVAGNHDDGRDGDINNYTKCLPDHIGNITGDYGVEYYFDYGNQARFIQISPDIDNYGFDYGDGSEHMKWLMSTIDSARTKNLDWIVVSMHKNCITPGNKECEIGSGLLNMLVDKKVDLVLQGHEHSYFRSKQLALNVESCPAIIVNEFNQSCVVDEGNLLDKDSGTVIVITGAGGRSLRGVTEGDAETDYFASINAKNMGDSYGFSLFEFKEGSLVSKFIPAVGGFTDSFTIQ